MGASSQHFDDDLFAPLPDSMGLGGPGPFVINLSSSTVPISLPNSGISVAPNTRVYQIRRTEDRSVRYRLRLGPFVTEAQANAALAVVRDTYPAALTATATSEDLASFTDICVEAPKMELVVTVATPPPKVSPPQLAQTPAAPLPPVLTPSAPAPTKTTASVRKPPLQPLAFPAAKTSEGVAARNVRIPTKVKVPAAPPPKAPAPVPVTAAPKAAPAISAQSWPSAEELQQSETSLESTQTLRTLTASELEDPDTLRWFAIDLAISTQAFNPDAIPKLDIFSVYRLYTVQACDSGTVTHTLRLGFFSEAIAAQAVADYLADHYEKPSVKRVSLAERERFSTQRLEARKVVEATGRHAVIEITDQRYIRERRTAH